MNINLIRISEILFPMLLFSPGLRGLGLFYYLFLGASFIFSIPLISFSYLKIFKSNFLTILVIFYIITGIGLISSFDEYNLFSILFSLSRISLCIIFVFVFNSYKNKLNTNKITKYYLIATFIASSFIYIQFFIGPIDFFSEPFSMRTGLPRFSTTSGSTNIFSVSVAFSILISTFIKDRINFFRSSIVLLIYQLFILGAAVTNLTRSGMFASIGAFLFARIFLFFKKLNPKFFEDIFIIPLRFKIFNFKLKLSQLLGSIFIGITFVTFSEMALRYIRTMLFFLTDNKQLIISYSDATFETRSLGSDIAYRLVLFDPQFFSSLLDHPLNIIFGGGSKYFGGTIGIPRGYSHNMFIDIFQAQGFLGLLLFLFLLINLFNKSQNSSFYKFNFSLDIRSLTITLLFIFLCTHNSGIIFHPLTVFPLLFVQDFLQSSKPFEKKKEYLA